MSYKVLTSEAELNEALSNDSFLLFKHSLTCPISAESKRGILRNFSTIVRFLHI